MSRGERITLYVMGAIGVVFWIAAIAIPGWQPWMIIFAAVLVAWVAFQLLLDQERGEE